MEKNLSKVLRYFSTFKYSPTFEEVYTFFPTKICKKSLKYTPLQYSKKISNIKYQISNKKLSNIRFRGYIKLLSLFPQIKLIGLSGSISMMNAKEDDDIDIFIITAKNRLFTGRFIALALAQLLCLRRHRAVEKLDALFSTATPPRGPLAIVSKKASSLLTSHQSLITSHYANKVCLNLFFDERDLKVPKFKQSIYVGHEVLQMKPLVVKDDIYQRFLKANEWVFILFPNAPRVIPVKTGIYKIKHWILLNNLIEAILKYIQLTSINRHRTTEIITSSQLWFHPVDYASFM